MSLTLYIGSDPVILNPSFDFQKNKLSATTDHDHAVRQACRRDAAGVLNTYRIDLDSVAENDVVIEQDRITICSLDALDALNFVGASFVHRMG